MLILQHVEKHAIKQTGTIPPLCALTTNYRHGTMCPEVHYRGKQGETTLEIFFKNVETNQTPTCSKMEHGKWNLFTSGAVCILAEDQKHCHD